MSSPLLNIGARSLAAAQGTLTTISHNIANANTPGYTRQEAVLSTAGGLFSGAGFFGRGVDLATVKRQYDAFLTASVHGSASAAAADAARSTALQGLDSLFADAQLGVGAALDGLFAAAGDLANRPADATARQAFLSRADQLAQRITGIGAQMAELGRLADSRLAQEATQVNERLGQINVLNGRIAHALASGHQPNDLLDQRDTAVQALNGLLSVRAVPVGDGTVSLFTASGAPLLVGSRQSVLRAEPDPADRTRIALVLDSAGVRQPLARGELAGGSMAGLLRFRDEDLASATNQLGRLAVVVAERTNAQQALGIDASGAPGLPLFDVAPAEVLPHSANTGAAALGATVVDPGALKASDYEVQWDGAAYRITRLADGQATSAAALPATVDGLRLQATGAPAAGDRWLLRPFGPAASGLAARPLAPQQLATAYAATAEAAPGNRGGVVARAFAVERATPDTTLPVTIRFNDPPTTVDITGLAGGNLAGVPYVPGARIPAAPADHNGWSLVLDGTPQAGDSFTVRTTTAPRSDNRNALALGAIAQLRTVDGVTLNEAYAALIGDTGARAQSARELAGVSEQVHADTVARQQAGAGVNLEEEAANLLRFQQAYQASAKIIQASQSLFDALLAATGR